MHFVTFVITSEKPLGKVLAPFGPDGNRKWDALGGRYSANLQPISFENTITGGDDIPAIELQMLSMFPPEVKPSLHGTRGHGVDAAQIKNLSRDCLIGVGSTISRRRSRISGRAFSRRR
jgi:hypothetical protein